jgi:CRISPR-associated protein Cas1
MAWRGLHISRAARLSLADGQIVVGQDAGETRLALEDLAWLVIDTPQATISAALLSACMDAGIAVILTDERHMPNGMALPFHTHHRQAAVAALQMEAGAGLRGRLWQALVRAKIRNQAAVLGSCGGDPDALAAMAGRVQPGDPENVEARAARHYWGALFDGFVREDGTDFRNAMLNYGYAVLRGGVARALVAAGLLPALGLHHASQLNAFNLADDVIEPFRPIVDLAVWRMAGGRARVEGTLSLAQRQTLAGVLLEPAMMGHETVTVLVATEMTAVSLVRALEGASAKLLTLPVTVAAGAAA